MSRDDLIKLLIKTGMSYTRPKDAQIVADDGHTPAKATITRVDAISQAARPVCELAASRVDGDDVKVSKNAVGRFSR